MRLLDRYLLRELLIPLGFCLVGFYIFWVTFDLLQQLDRLLGFKLSWGDIFWYYLYLSPKFLVIVMPIGLLLGLLMTMTGLARHNEITAMRTAGVSLWRLAAPYFGVGLVFSLAVFAANELWVPDSVERAEQIRFRHATERANPHDPLLRRSVGFINPRDRRVWHVGEFNMVSGEMANPQVTYVVDGARHNLFAERAAPTNGAWLFSNVTVYRESQASNARPEPILRTNALFMSDFHESLAVIRSDLKMNDRLRERRAKEVDVPLFEILNYLRLHPNPEPRDRDWLYTELNGRLAAPWTSLVVVLIALPFGAASGRRNAFVGVASAIFICFGFYILQQVGLALGAGGWVPAWVGGWFPNLTFGIVGLWLTLRVR